MHFFPSLSKCKHLRLRKVVGKEDMVVLGVADRIMRRTRAAEISIVPCGEADRTNAVRSYPLHPR